MVLIKAKDLSNHTVFLSFMSYNQAAFTDDFALAEEFKSERDARLWYEGHKEHDPVLQNYYRFQLLTVSKTNLD